MMQFTKSICFRPKELNILQILYSTVFKTHRPIFKVIGKKLKKKALKLKDLKHLKISWCKVPTAWSLFFRIFLFSSRQNYPTCYGHIFRLVVCLHLALGTWNRLLMGMTGNLYNTLSSLWHWSIWALILLKMLDDFYWVPCCLFMLYLCYILIKLIILEKITGPFLDVWRFVNSSEVWIC